MGVQTLEQAEGRRLGLVDHDSCPYESKIAEHRLRTLAGAVIWKAGDAEKIASYHANGDCPPTTGPSTEWEDLVQSNLGPLTYGTVDPSQYRNN